MENYVTKIEERYPCDIERGERLRQLRLERKLSQKEVASRISITQSLLAMFEGGVRRVTDEHKVMFADFYNVGVQELFYDGIEFKQKKPRRTADDR